MQTDAPIGIEVVAIVGPTASGKSAVADELAYRLDGEVVSTDAMQVYRHMDIGTAKTPVSQRRVPLHCVDLVDPGEPFSVALFADYAHAAIDDIRMRGQTPVICGGTGLYVRAALENMSFPAGEQTNNPVRAHFEKLAAELGPDDFHHRLEQIDPESAALIHPNNVRRVVRAFELLEQGTTYAREHETLHKHADRHTTLHIGLTMPRDILYSRINDRVDRMFEQGLVDEVRSLVRDGFADTLTARQAIGYKEIFGVLDGSKTAEQAADEIKQATRRYAKRQLTWFRADERIVWLDSSEKNISELCTDIMNQLHRTAKST